MKKCGIIISAILALMLISCATTESDGTLDERAVAAGIKAWNEYVPEEACAYWDEIADEKLRAKYKNYVVVYKDGTAALESADSIKSSNESKLLAACNAALDKFSAVDSALKLPSEVCKKGASLCAGRIDSFLAAGKLTAARKLYARAVDVYGIFDELATANKEIDVVSSLFTKKSALDAKAKKIAEVELFDDKIAAYSDAVSDYSAVEKEINAAAANYGVGKKRGVSSNVRTLTKARQDLEIERASVIRARAYGYKDRIGEEFARSPETGDSGKMSLEEILAHYKSVEANIDMTYQQLLVFASKYPAEIGQDIIDDIDAQKKDLQNKIAQVNSEIRTAQEIASRGKVVLPLLIGLFNPDPGSTAESKKSRPAKFSASNAKKDEYWWGMVSIPGGQMNDLVVTLKDNRTVRVFAENTKSGRLIKKNNIKDLVNRSYKVGNSWPVLNAGSQLTSNKYFFEVQKGKTRDYAGEVVVYSSFIVRMR